jgi:uncharacterized protein YbjQ (UPF0145 family)
MADSTAEGRLSSSAGGPTAGILPPAGFVALRAAGFEPVGRVRARASYHVELSGPMTGDWRAFDCRPATDTTAATNRAAPAPVRLSGTGASSTVLVEVLEGARRKALERLRVACTELGGHGVVAVRVGVTPSSVASLGMDFSLSGVAVRAPGVVVAGARPFVSHLAAQGLAKLLLAGWVPVDLLVGRAIGVRHEDLWIRNQLRSATNQELEGWTSLLAGVRAGARARLEEQAAEQGGDGILLDGDEVTLEEQRCEAGRRSPGRKEPTDRVATCILVGTSIVRFATTPVAVQPLAVIPLRGGLPRQT